MEPLDYLRLLRRRWRLVVACMVVAVAAAWITTPAEPSAENITYEATATMVRDPQETGQVMTLGTVALFVRTGEVPTRVAELIGYEGNPVLLARGIVTEVDETTGTLAITASGSSPEAAAELANHFSEETRAFIAEQAQATVRETLAQVELDIADLRAEIDDLDAQIDANGGEESPDAALLVQERENAISEYGVLLSQQSDLQSQGTPTSGYITLEPALPELATTPDGGIRAPQSKPVRVALGAALGLLLGLGVVLVIERLDPRITTRAAAERAFDLPVVAEVPHVSGMRRNPYELRAVTEPTSAIAEAYRNLRAALVLMPRIVLGAAGHDGQRSRPSAISSLFRRSANLPGPTDGASPPPSVILVTSASPSEGKTTTVANLAATFAEAGRNVLVLGFDFRRPEVHRHLGVADTSGLAEVFAGKSTLAEACQPTSIERVSLVTHGHGLDNHGEIAAEGRAVIEQARHLADVVLVDTAPILATSDAVELAPAVDAVVLIARAGSTTRESAGRCVDLLTRLSAPVTGVVLIGAPDTTTSYASYYYHQAAADDGKGRRRGKRRRAAADATAS